MADSAAADSWADWHSADWLFAADWSFALSGLLRVDGGRCHAAAGVPT